MTFQLVSLLAGLVLGLWFGLTVRLPWGRRKPDGPPTVPLDALYVVGQWRCQYSEDLLPPLRPGQTSGVVRCRCGTMCILDTEAKTRTESGE